MALRLYDELQTYGGGVLCAEHAEPGRHETQEMREHPVVVLDNVTRYLYEISGKDGYRTGTELPPVFPPFERAFIETRAPQQILDSKGRSAVERSQDDEPPPGVSTTRWSSGIGDAIPERWGYYMRCRDLKRELEDNWHKHQAAEVGSHLKAEGVPDYMRRRATTAPVRWLISASYYIEGAAWARLATWDHCRGTTPGADRPVGPLVRVVLGLSEDGELVRYSGSEDRMRIGIPLMQPGTHDRLAEIVGTNAVQHFNPMMLGMALMNCQNVPVEKESPAAAPHKASAKKQRTSRTSYYVLNIKPMEELLESTGRLKEVGFKRAFHLCRGYIRIYTPEGGGPFGRPIEEPVAQYVSPHTRGAKSEGEKHKDYQVGAPGKDPVFKSGIQPPGTPSAGMIRTHAERPAWARAAEPHNAEPGESQAREGTSEPAGEDAGNNQAITDQAANGDEVAADTAAGAGRPEQGSQPESIRQKLARALRQFTPAKKTNGEDG